MEGAKKRGRHCTVWTNESEEDLNIMGIKTGRQGQGPSAVEDGCTGDQGPQQTVALDDDMMIIII